mmetsp:Transcript_3651/g.8821  ORF Transcript_3651/g.8821 Transcript_3651/m.8821 type:complete len:216 (+) Transcript_3651:202-849(+)
MDAVRTLLLQATLPSHASRRRALLSSGRVSLAVPASGPAAAAAAMVSATACGKAGRGSLARVVWHRALSALGDCGPTYHSRTYPSPSLPVEQQSTEAESRGALLSNKLQRAPVRRVVLLAAQAGDARHQLGKGAEGGQGQLLLLLAKHKPEKGSYRYHHSDRKSSQDLSGRVLAQVDSTKSNWQPGQTSTVNPVHRVGRLKRAEKLPKKKATTHK